VRTTGLDLPIDLREFARRKDRQGDTHLTFGIKSWVPAPVRFVLGLPEVVPFHYVVKKKHHRHKHRDDEESRKDDDAGKPDLNEQDVGKQDLSKGDSRDDKILDESRKESGSTD
jgi:hypothetical protein